MIRQLGGAFGIALVNIFLSQKNPVHRIDLLRYITPYNELAQERVAAVTQGLVSRGMSTEQAVEATSRIMDMTVVRQAAVLSFNEAFLLVGILFAAALPLIFLIKDTKGATPVAAH
jgi:DHA2 family multidrug resistance protein